MQTNRLIAALVCATIGLASGAAIAQPVPGGPNGYHEMDHGPDGRGAPGHGPEHEMPRPPEHVRAEPPHHDWRKGEHVEAEYRNRQYVVDDWHGHGLRQPPRGYEWVGVGADYLLIAAASGVIAQVVMSH